MNHSDRLLTIIIKTLNEETRIADCLDAAVGIASTVDGEIIVADSHSTDKTIDIAKRFPVVIAQLSKPRERGCGIGAQLGYQESAGKYIWILDGDMVPSPSFVHSAISYLEAHPEVAGVGGLVAEMNLQSMEFQERIARAAKLKIDASPYVVDRLNGSAIYRRSAIESVEYFSNRNLHAYEEYELAIRLRVRGWRLVVLPQVAANHFGHTTEAYMNLVRRWKSRYVDGAGELIRSSIGKAHAPFVLREVRELRLYFVVVIWWIALASSISLTIAGLVPIVFTVSLLLVPVLAMSIKKQSIGRALYSVVAWQFYAAGMLRGLFRTPTSPITPIERKLVPNTYSCGT